MCIFEQRITHVPVKFVVVTMQYRHQFSLIGGKMPHPTPYSRQFDAIRATFPRLFESPGKELRPHDKAVAGEVPTDDKSNGREQGKSAFK